MCFFQSHSVEGFNLFCERNFLFLLEKFSDPFLTRMETEFLEYIYSSFWQKIMFRKETLTWTVSVWKQLKWITKECLIKFYKSVALCSCFLSNLTLSFIIINAGQCYNSWYNVYLGQNMMYQFIFWIYFKAIKIRNITLFRAYQEDNNN